MTSLQLPHWFKNLSPEFRRLSGLILGVTVARMIVASLVDLGNDEAYYWAWSKHIDLSYFDHPPMVAYLIRGSTFLFGDGTLAVRLPAILLSAGFLFLMYILSARLYSPRIGWLAALLCVLSPVTFVLGFLMLPDAPLLFFSALVLCLFWSFVEGKRNLWWLGGVMLGCALLSKYNGILLCVSVITFLVTGSVRDRRLLFDWRLVGIAGFALVVFSPVIIWNARHEWVSFGFQLRHGFAGAQSIWGLPSLLLAHTGYVSPVIWVGSVRVLVRTAREILQNKGTRFIASFGGLQVLFFVAAGLKSPGLPHWTAMGYAVLFIGLAAWCDVCHTVKKRMLWGGSSSELCRCCS